MLGKLENDPAGYQLDLSTTEGHIIRVTETGVGKDQLWGAGVEETVTVLEVEPGEKPMVTRNPNSVAPNRLEYFPAGQRAQECWPKSEYCPATQF